MNNIELTLLAFTDDDKDSFAKRKVVVMKDSIAYFNEIDMLKPLPIIGEEDNITKGTQITFNNSKVPSIVVTDTVEEIIAKLNENLSIANRVTTATEASVG